MSEKVQSNECEGSTEVDDNSEVDNDRTWLVECYECHYKTGVDANTVRNKYSNGQPCPSCKKGRCFVVAKDRTDAKNIKIKLRIKYQMIFLINGARIRI